MRLNYLIASLLLYPFYSFSGNALKAEVFFAEAQLTEKNSIIRSFSSEEGLTSMTTNLATRTIDYPTQVIRITHDIEHLELSCEEVNEKIDEVLINKITKDKFFFSTFISCAYEPATHKAIQFTLNSYFDPINDEAISYLNTYLDENNGREFLGTQLTIESAKALVVSLNISVGIKKNPKNPPFIVSRSDRHTLYFKSSYELKIGLINDIQERFITDNPDNVMPFLDKWFFDHAGAIYKSILRDSNYVLLEPERIFIMDSGEPIFVSFLKYYYEHNCTVYEHHHCLKQEL